MPPCTSRIFGMLVTVNGLVGEELEERSNLVETWRVICACQVGRVYFSPLNVISNVGAVVEVLTVVCWVGPLGGAGGPTNPDGAAPPTMTLLYPHTESITAFL